MDRATNGKLNLAKLLIKQDDGDYFDKNGEMVKRGFLAVLDVVVLDFFCFVLSFF